MTASAFQRAPRVRNIPGRIRLFVLGAGVVAVLLLGAVRLLGGSIWGSCSADVDAALGRLQPHAAADLSLTEHWSLDADDDHACTKRVLTSRSADKVIAHYRSELEAHHWQVRVRPQKDLEGQCSSGPGQCQSLEAFGDGVCFALTTDTVPPEQAITADRTSLFFFAAPCVGIADFGNGRLS
jgi:hypothetical protein